MNVDQNERISTVESKVDRILNLLLKFFAGDSAGKATPQPPPLTKPEAIDYERELRAIQCNVQFLRSADEMQTTDMLYTSDGRRVPVRRRGRAF